MTRRRQNIARAAARETTNLRANMAPPPLVRPHFPGVDTEAWSDLPPAQYPPDTVSFIRTALELGDNLKRVQGYRCDVCDLVLATYDRHPGHSPRYLDHKLILASSCPGTFVSFGYPDEDLPGGAAPAIEWHRPSELVLESLPDPFIDHVLRGGLIMRLNPDAAPADTEGVIL